MNSQNQPNMDDLLKNIRNEQPEPAVIDAAASRVWARVSGATHEVGKIRGCVDFQAMIPDWKDGRLADSRKVLLEDGDLLEFFKTIYFFVECLAVIGAVPADYPAPART